MYDDSAEEIIASKTVEQRQLKINFKSFSFFRKTAVLLPFNFHINKVKHISNRIQKFEFIAQHLEE